MGLAGAGVALGAVPAYLKGEPFSVTRDGRKIHFLVGNQTRWTIDPDQFDGNPSILLKRDENRIHLSLKDAFFPGTRLPASFNSIIERSDSGWSMAMATESGLDVQADFLPWLLAQKPATGLWKKRRIRPFEGFAMRFDGPIDSAFRPDWSIEARGPSNALVRGLAAPLRSNSWRLAMNEGEALAGGQLGAKTSFTVRRHDASWDVDLTRSSAAGWRLSHGDDLFHILRVESANGPNGPSRTGLLAQTEDGSATLRLHTGGGLLGDSGDPFYLTLENPRIAFGLEDGAPKSALMAEVSEKPVWAHAADVSLLLAGGGAEPRFEFVEEDDKACAPKISPEVLTATFPDSDEAKMQLDFKDKRPLPFNWTTVMGPVDRFLGALHLLPGEHSLAFDLTCGDRLHVLRPQDLLVLTFQFENMRLHTGANPDIARYAAPGGNTPTSPDVGDEGCPNKQAPNLRCAPAGGLPKVTVVLPPQHVVEQAFFFQGNFKENVDLPDEDLKKVPLPSGTAYSPDAAKQVLDPDYKPNNPKPTDPFPSQSGLPCAARMAQESCLVFTLPEKHGAIPLQIERLLDWSRWQPYLAPVAKYAEDAAKAKAENKPPIPPPLINQPIGFTSIELPCRLIISPKDNGRWAHAPTPKDYGTDVFEIWHTRLGIQANDKDNKPTVEENTTDRTIRAIWSPDYSSLNSAPPHDNTPFRMSLDRNDRHQIVHLTSDFNISDAKGPFSPSPVPVDQLMLSSMGGWLKSFGVWDPPMNLTVQQWKHAATMGRDNYVRVVYKGYLLPFGHRASLVKVTERRFDKALSGGQVGKTFAYLHQRMFVVVQKPRKDFPVLGQTSAGRQFPFKRIDALTLVTPDLAQMADQSLFWVIVDPSAGPFPMRFRFWDCDGAISEADVSVVFADASIAYYPATAQPASALFNGGYGSTNAQCPPDATMSCFKGQKLAFAPSSKPGNTQYEVQDIRWQTSLINNPDAKTLYTNDLPCFFPFVESAHVTSSAVKRVTPQTDPAKVHFYQKYLTSGFDPKANRGEVFLELDPSASLKLQFGGSATPNVDKAGGLASPDTVIVGFSRKSGPVGGTPTQASPAPALGAAAAPPSSSLDTWSSGTFDPTSFFGGLSSAKILGGLKISDIIAAIDPGVASNLAKAPQMLEQSLFAAISVLSEAEGKIILIIDGMPFFVNRQLATQRSAVDSTYATVQGLQPNDLTAALAHSALIGAIVHYGDALKALIEDPSQLADALWQGVSPYFVAFQASLFQSLQPLAGFVLDRLQDVGDCLTTIPVSAVKAQLPEFASYADLLPVARDLIARTTAFSQKLKSLTADQAPAIIDQLGGILDDLLQVFERTGYLTGSDLTALSTAIGAADTKFCQMWLDLKLDAHLLDGLEESCMRVAALLDTQEAQAALQTLRQIQKSAQWLLAPSARPPARTPAIVWQIFQVQQQLLSGVQALNSIASGHANVIGTVANDLVRNSNAVASGFSLVDSLISSPIEGLFGAAASLDDVANSLSVRLASLAGDLGPLRCAITAEVDPAKQMALKIQHSKLSLQYRSPFAVFLELTQAGVPAAQSALQRIKGLQAFSNQVVAGCGQLSSSITSVTTAFNSLQTGLTGVPAMLLSSFVADVTKALGVPATRPCEMLRKGQQASQTLTRLVSQLQQSVQTAVSDLEALATAKLSLSQLLALIPIPQQVTLSYDFLPTLKNFDPVFTLRDGATFTIHAQTTVPLGGNVQPTYQIGATLTNFTINLIGQPDFVNVIVDKFSFSSNSGASPETHVVINTVKFGEALSFVEELADLLDPSEGPFLEFADAMIRTGFRFQVPTIMVGAFNMMQLSLTVAVGLPFNGDPARFEFAISSMDSPFLLSTGIYGGGGFLRLLLGLDGVEKLEGALEFGVVADIDIGPVSGIGYVMAGIYFSVEASSSKVCGFVHAHGHVDLSDIAQMDIDVYVAICYEEGSVVGSATITVHVEVLFFSQDFKLTATYQFAGKKQDNPSTTLDMRDSMGSQSELVSGPRVAVADMQDAKQQFCDLDPAKWREYYVAFAA